MEVKDNVAVLLCGYGNGSFCGHVDKGHGSVEGIWDSLSFQDSGSWKISVTHDRTPVLT